MFGKSVRYVAASVAPAMGAIFVGTLLIAVFPWLTTALPSWLGSR
jgi:TRAP-type C4-dicarboxylate transport system permease large subunit